MDEPEIDAVPVRVESNAPYPPGMIESQEFREEGDVAHCWGARERGLSRKGIGVSAIRAEEIKGENQNTGVFSAGLPLYPVPLDSPP